MTEYARGGIIPRGEIHYFIPIGNDWGCPIPFEVAKRMKGMKELLDKINKDGVEYVEEVDEVGDTEEGV